MKGAPKGVALPAQAGYVDLFASSTPPPTSSPVQPHESGYSLDQADNMFSDVFPEERFDNHPLFRDGRSVISRIDKDEPWMRLNALQLLGLYGTQSVIKGEPHKQLVVAAKLDSTLREIRGLELRPYGSKKGQDECLLLVRRERGFVAFDDVDVAGLPADGAAWFRSLKGRIVRRSIYTEEMRCQADHNEDAFRTFYREGLKGFAPDFYSSLYAWVALDSGRILCVGGSPFPSEKNDGAPTSFKAAIAGGAALVTCTKRGVLYGMPGLYHAYFEQLFVKIRDVVPAMEEGVPEEGQGRPDSDAVSNGVLA